MTQRRGERRARAMLNALAKVGVQARFEKVNGEWGVGFPGYRDFTREQKEVARDVVLLAFAYPRCFATLARLHREEGAHDDQ